MEDGRDSQISANGEPNGEAGIGRTLEQARRERGLSLEQVEQDTKIRKRYLAGLEREDYTTLPDAVYARGFLKTYANYLGLDGEELSRQLRSRRRPRRERGIDYSPPNTDFERPLITPGGVAGTEKRKVSTSTVVTVLVGLLALAAVIIALYFVGRDVQLTRAQENAAPRPAATEETPGGPRQEEAEPEALPTEDGPPERELVNRTEDATGPAEAEGAGGEAPATEAGQSAPPDTLMVAITVRERPSWLLIRADGVLAYEETAQPGFTQTFEADRQLSITSGDAGAVTVEVNGQEAGPLGGMGEVVTRSFTLKKSAS
ncbi:MAG: DUF4115 domain-containing protein [Actinomycetota bacterium]|nr:DUF4115 domain-containing protein [Actinomycetota bacterium]